MLAKATKSCCKRGCNYCCYQQIEVLNIEESEIRRKIKQHLPAEQIQEITNDINLWLDFFDANTPKLSVISPEYVFSEFSNACAENQIKCPFLVGGECAIYDYRPLTCRIHMVLDDPEDCNINRLRHAFPDAHDLRLQIRDELAEKVGIYTIPLVYTVADIFVPKRRLKKIRKREIWGPSRK